MNDTTSTTIWPRVGQAALALVVFTLPATSQTVPPDAAVAQAEIIGQQIDANRDGVIVREELRAFGEALYQGMDADSSGLVQREELSNWQFGMAEIADFRGRQQAFETSVDIVFDIFDRDNDQAVSVEEHVRAFDGALDLADLDGDGAMTIREYMDGFIYNIAIRNALSD